MPVATTVDIRDIELAKEGTYAAVSPGRFTVTRAHLEEIVRASKDSEVDRAILKLGHYDQRFLAQDGDPALGYVTNLRLSNEGVLIGDFTDVPAGLAPAITKAYKSRSIEAKLAKGPEGIAIVTQSGRKYSAVLTGVALLGVAAPAIAGLKDIEALYAGRDTADAPVEGDTVLVAFEGVDDADRVQALHEARAAVTVFASKAGLDGKATQSLLDNLDTASELMRDSDDASGHDGAQNRKEDTPVPVDEKRLRELLKDEDEKIVNKLVAALSSDGDGGEGDGTPAKTTEEETKKTEIEPGKTTETETEKKVEEAKLPDGMTAISAAVLEELRTQAKAGADAAAELSKEKVDAEIIAAMRAGKVAPAERDMLVDLMMSKPVETRKLIASRPAVLPTTEAGSDSAVLVAPDDAAWAEFEKNVFGFEDESEEGK